MRQLQDTVHSTTNPLAPAKDAAHLATCFPQAEYHEVADGGHIFFVVHHKSVVSSVERFLLEHAPK